MTPEQQTEQQRARRFGWTSLCVWAALGFGLETAHGFKWPPYVDDELTRTLLRLGHAHGVGLALVMIAYSESAVRLLSIAPTRPSLEGRLLRWAAVLMPVGFSASAFGHPEGDPSFAIGLVPLGALALLVALGLITRAAWRDP